MHDSNGTPLQVGDVVAIYGTITACFPTDDYCNVTVETVHGRRPDRDKSQIGALNTAQVTLVERPTPE